MGLGFRTQTLQELQDLDPDLRNTDPQAWLELLFIRYGTCRYPDTDPIDHTYLGSYSLIGLTLYATEIMREGHKSPKV
jgi:hypothetical protein